MGHCCALYYSAVNRLYAERFGAAVTLWSKRRITVCTEALPFYCTCVFDGALLRNVTHGTVCLIIPTYASECTFCTIHIRLATVWTVHRTYPDGGNILSTRAEDP